MFTILLTLLVIVAVLMIGVILVQKSEGSGMSGSSAGAMFAGIMTGSSAGNFLTKLTAILATIFFVLCAILAIVVSRQAGIKSDSALRQELVLEEQVETIDVQKSNPQDVSVSDKKAVVPEN